jgi:hypothetical protein
LPLGNIILNCMARLGAQPGTWSDLRLPYQPIGIGKVKSLHYRIDCSRNFSGVWVAYSELERVVQCPREATHLD